MALFPMDSVMIIDANSRIAFQGEHGAYSELAIRSKISESVTTIPCLDFHDIFDAVMIHTADYALLPVENSIAGTVLPAYDLLLKSNLKPSLEIIIPIHHHLLVKPGTKMKDLTAVASHPQALAQCRLTLESLSLSQRPSLDTAGAAKALSQSEDASIAAIASELAAETYGLDILRSNIEDYDLNQTRFLLLGPTEAPYQQDKQYKTSIAFTAVDRPNALAQVLNQFTKHHINLCKIESHPSRVRPWDYCFYADFIGHHQQDADRACLESIKPLTASLQLLGSYLHSS